MTQQYVDTDDFITLLLKCIGSPYPVTIFLADNSEIHCFVKGFSDAACSSMEIQLLHRGLQTVPVQQIKAIQSPRVLAVRHFRGNVFYVGEESLVKSK